ncbi:MAG TPA: hypothetical protein PLT20_12980, partial [Sedimentisphaerales bacterium]|nr:hypothetical protein [Sedimentisphaerales bacterium]
MACDFRICLADYETRQGNEHREGDIMLRLAHRILSQANCPLPELYGEKRTHAEATRKAAVVNLKAGLPIIIADNVAVYLNTGKTIYDQDIPPFPAPFPKFFVEWNEPEIIHDPVRGRISRRDLQKVQTGYYAFTIPREKVESGYWADENYQTNKENIGGCFVAIHWQAGPEGIALPIGSLIVFLDQAKKYLCSGGFWLPEARFAGDGQAASPAHAMEAAFLFFTLAFMQCKNVHQKDATATEGPTPKWCRRQRLPELKYHTLQIDPSATTRPHSDARKTEGDRSGKALHICRGHFAH